MVRVDGAEVASGEWLQPEDVRKRMDAAKDNLATALEDFTLNTLSYVRRDRDLLLEGLEIPTLRTRLRDRHVLVVVRGHDYKKDLSTLRGYIQEFRPALIGVDGGADALLEVGLKPDLILGDMDSVTNEALTSGAEIVVHAYPDGRAPGKERVEALGLEPLVLPGAGTSEDMAMLLAYESDCDLIVAVGSHASMVEFLDKGRPGMASTFLTRLKVGPKLVDAKGVNRLYRQGVRRSDLHLPGRGRAGRHAGDLARLGAGQAGLERPHRAAPGVLQPGPFIVRLTGAGTSRSRAEVCPT